MKSTTLAFTTLLLLAPCLAMAAPPETPTKLNGVQTVDHAYLVKAGSDKSAMLVDFRPAAQYSAGTIPGAANCPGIKQDPTDLKASETAAAKAVVNNCSALTSAAKDKEIIAFCGSDTCWVSPKAASALVQMGYTNVKWYRDGYAGWKAGASK